MMILGVTVDNDNEDIDDDDDEDAERILCAIGHCWLKKNFYVQDSHQQEDSHDCDDEKVIHEKGPLWNP